MKHLKFETRIHGSLWNLTELLGSKNGGIMKSWDVKRPLISGLLLQIQEQPVRKSFDLGEDKVFRKEVGSK